MSIISQNIRFLRKQAGYTQQDIADKIGIKRSLVGAYEEGRAEPPIENLHKFSEAFNVSVDMLISEDLTTGDPIIKPGLKVLSITVDNEDNENIELVPDKAAAGYLDGYADPEYIKELPKFQLPFLPKNATYRAFEIKGDSMLPILPGTVVIGEYVESLEDIKNGKTYIMVTEKEGIVFKRVFNYMEERGKLFLVSDNKIYAPYEMGPEEVLEIWSAKAYISVQFPEPTEETDMTLEQLAGMVISLKDELSSLKRGLND